MTSSSATTSSPATGSDRWLARLAATAAALVAGVLLLIVIYLVWSSWPLLTPRRLVEALAGTQWYPAEGKFGMLAMLVGSLGIGALALLIATPCGVAVAIWGRYYARPGPAAVFRGGLELMSGIPSVVYGLWGLTVVVPWINRITPPGASVLAGGIVLALMILPLVALSADAGLESVPPAQIRAAAAMGLSRWGTVRRIALPHAMPAVVAGATLQGGRALGETMAVLMVCGNVVQLPGSLFDPVRTLTANIALEMAYASELHQTALFLSGLLLLVLTVLVMTMAYRPRGAANGP